MALLVGFIVSAITLYPISQSLKRKKRHNMSQTVIDFVYKISIVDDYPLNRN